MQIKDLPLLELFVKTMCSVMDSPSQCKLEGSPLADQIMFKTRETTLAKQLNGRDCFMVALADKYEVAGEYKLAAATRELAEFLSKNDSLSYTDQETHQRLLDYVYPVV